MSTVFKQKIATSDIVSFFPDYSGKPGDVQAGCEYFSHRFQALNQNPQKQVYVHLTCATGEPKVHSVHPRLLTRAFCADTTQIKFVLSAVNDIIIQANLRDCGLL